MIDPNEIVWRWLKMSELQRQACARKMLDDGRLRLGSKLELIPVGDDYDAQLSDMVERVAHAIGCIEADRCAFANSSKSKDREKCGSCDDCLNAARRAVEALAAVTAHR